MPIYAFECTGCGHHFERLQRLSDADPSQCPECESTKVRRQLTAPSFRLAGGGWYETDFKKDGKRNLAEKSDAGKSDSGKSDPGKSDSGAPAAGSSAPATKEPAGGTAGSKPAAESARPAPAKPAPPKPAE